MLLTVNRNLFSHGYNFVGLARVGMLDMALILAMTLAVWLAWRSQRDPKQLVWLGVPLGLGLMIKSIAGFLAYGIVALFFLAALPRSVWWRRETAWGFLVSVLIAAPWHLGQLLVWGRQFYDSYVVSLTVGYVTGEQGHTKDLLFYLRTIRRGFPILYPVLAAAAAYGLYRAWRHRERGPILLLCWVAVPMLLYNVSRSRIGWYMIPIYPALALLAALLLVRAVGARWSLAIILGATLAFNPWLPRAGDFSPGVKAVAVYSRYALNDNSVLVNYWPDSYWIRPSALFYADRPFLLVTSAQALGRLLATPGDFYVLADAKDWESVQELGRVLYSSGSYVLAAGSPAASGVEADQ